MRILFHNAKILTMVDDRIIAGDLVVIDKRIAYIGNESANYGPFDRIVECNGNLLMPGFKNAHAHSAMVFLRDVPKNVTLQEWLFDYVFPREERLQHGDVYHLNKVSYLEYLEGGITFCFEHYFFPPESAESAKDFGMRTLLLGCYSLGVTSTNIDEIERLANLYNNEEDGLVRYLVGFHAEYTTDDSLLNGTKEAMDRVKMPFYTHISETVKEVKECFERHQKTPLQYLYEEGLFKYGGGGFHCCHLTDEEVRICKENNLNIISCPGSNDYLGSGEAPLSKYLKEGIRIALGTDGPASNESLDMFREMRLAATLEGVDIPAYEVLKMATINGAYAMGLYDADVLAKDKYADIIMLDLSKPNLKGSKDLIYDLVHKASEDNVKLTMINGKVLYEDGQYFLNEDIEDIRKKVEEISQRIEKDL